MYVVLRYTYYFLALLSNELDHETKVVKNNSSTKETTAASNEATKSFCQLSFDLFFAVGF